MPTYTGHHDTDDTFVGGAGIDAFLFAPADLNAADTVTGGYSGANIDTLGLTAAGTVTAANLAGVTQIDRIAFVVGGISVALDDAFAAVNGAIYYGVTFYFAGSSGNDSFDASAVTLATVYDMLPGAGNDTLRGGAYNDIFRFNAADLGAGDIVAGGGGLDLIAIAGNGTYTAADLAGLSGIEWIRFLTAQPVNLTLDDAVAAANAAVLVIDLGTGSDTIDASAVTLASRAIDVSAGLGGNETLLGGAGDDVFRMNYQYFDGLDTIAGGAGIDAITLNSAGTLTAADLAGVSGIEVIDLVHGSSHTITITDALVSTAAGNLLTINANSDTVPIANIDASGVTDPANSIHFNANDPEIRGHFTGGAGDDVFHFVRGLWHHADTSLDGGGGRDTFVVSGSVNYAWAHPFESIEVIRIEGDNNSVQLGTPLLGVAVHVFGENNAVLGNYQGDPIDVTVHGANHVLIGSFYGGDTFRLAAEVPVSSIDGRDYLGEIDTIVAATNVDLRAATISGIEVLRAVAADADGVAIAVDVTVRMTGSQAEAFDTIAANGDFLGQTAELFAVYLDSQSLDLSGVTALHFDSRDRFEIVGTSVGDTIVGSGFADRVFGGIGDDAVSGGEGNDTLIAGTGTDTLDGGAHTDVLYFGADLTGADLADGGSGTDLLVVQGDYSAGYTFSAGNMTGIELLSVQSGAQTRWGDVADNYYYYDLATIDANVAAGQQMVVNAQSLRAGENFVFRGQAESDGRFLLYAGHGVDTVVGGAGNDVFFFEGTRWGASDVVFGGGGQDSVVLSGGTGVNTFAFGANSFFGIESISVNNRFATDPSQVPSYDLTLVNENVTAGGSLIVNGSSLGAAQTFAVDGTAVSGGRLLIYGGAGADELEGGSGHDTLFGGGSGDGLWGGAGNDVFRFDVADETDIDTVGDFTLGDVIDLSRIDADALTAGDQAFTFIGSAGFTGAGAASAGELMYVSSPGVPSSAFGDTDGDGVFDFALILVVADADPITGADFIL